MTESQLEQVALRIAKIGQRLRIEQKAGITINGITLAAGEADQQAFTPLPSWITSKRPWDEARKLKIMRYGHSKNEPADPGVNYFLLVLEELGAKPKTGTIEI